MSLDDLPLNADNNHGCSKRLRSEVMTMKLSISVCLLSLVAQGFALYPPVLWARTYFEGYWSKFHDVHETNDGNFIVSVETSIDPQFPVCLFNADGDTIWTGRSDMDLLTGYWVEELGDGSFIVTGVGRETPSSESGLLLAKYSSTGDLVWHRIYSLNESGEYGFCTLLLPDGGYLVTGRVNGSGFTLGQAWILRTDAYGDTLWTDIWGEYTVNWARRSCLTNDSLKVLTYGRIHPDSSRGPHILTYDMDGNLVQETRIAGLGGDQCRDMCFSPIDGGYTLTTYDHAKVVHVDDYGNILWSVTIPDTWVNYGLTINSTMDGGYIWGGYNRWTNPDSVWYHSGRLAKVSWDGAIEWSRSFAQVSCAETNSVRQLSQGGYIVAGFNQYNTGALVRFGPETGIEVAEPPLAANLDLSPNPFSNTLGIIYSLPTQGQIVLTVYDLSGRQVGVLENGIVPEGEYTSVWDPGELPSGCYIIMLRAGETTTTETCVLAR